MSIKKLLLITFLTITFLFSLLFQQCIQDTDTRFEHYTDELFRQEVQSNGITLHYTLKNPDTFQIYHIPTNLGQVSIDTDAMGAAAENALATLHTYNRNQLSTKNQLIYTLLENHFLASKSMAEYALYEEPLAPLTGTQSQLPILLSEYQFYSVNDIKTYLKLLKNIPDYFQGIMAFETAKSKQGLFMNEKRVDAVIGECDAFVNMGDTHYLHETFKTRIKNLNLSEEDYQTYIDQNISIINDFVYPAYESLKNHLLDLKSAGVNDNGLCYFSNGKKYYELLAKEVTGSNRTILEMQALTLKQINEDLHAMQDAVTEESPNNISPSEFSDSNPTALLATLKKRLSGNFPTPPDVNVSVKYIEEAMENYLSPAFYLIPAIDNPDDNTIYINPAHMNDDLALFTTLAHEGYPGHLYQTTYFSNTNPAPIRSLLGCAGYTEGWATYCEMMSYYFAPIPKSEAIIMQKNSSIMLGLYALADMGIHYEGWTLTDTIHFFREYGISDSAAIEEIFNLIIGDPANYLKYYIGYLEFLELKKDAIKTWGDEFSQERFHREILTAGPMSFDILRELMELPF